MMEEMVVAVPRAMPHWLKRVLGTLGLIAILGLSAWIFYTLEKTHHSAPSLETRGFGSLV